MTASESGDSALHSCLLFGNAMVSLKNYSAGNTSLHGIVTSDKEA